jgi:hypothetical protein
LQGGSGRSYVSYYIIGQVLLQQSAFGSESRGILKFAVPAICISAFLFGSKTVFGQFRLFGTQSFEFGKIQFGLGIDYLSELQKSLTISSSSGTVMVQDGATGTNETGTLNGDPRLLNRKFDIEWQMSGPGVHLPLTLSEPRLIGGAEIRPTLTLEALDGDFDLRFLNQREAGPDDSLHGRGLMYGVELAVRAESLGSRWFAESGYRFHSLPSVNAERSQPFTSPGVQVSIDESRLSRETHDAFTRVGYSFSGRDVLTYTGVRHRWANVEVQDDLRFVDTLLQETTLSSRTKLDSSASEAIVGVEARLPRSLVWRTEITFSNQDYGVLAAVVYAGRSKRRPRSLDHLKERAAVIAAEIAPKLKRIYNEFDKSRKDLPTFEIPGTGRAYLAEPLLELLQKTEKDLLDALSGHVELIALQDYVRHLFARTRGALQLQYVAQAGGPIPQALFVAARPLYVPAMVQTNKKGLSADGSASLLEEILIKVGIISDEADRKDLVVEFCVTSSPNRARFKMHPISPMPGEPPGTNTRGLMKGWRGLYTYTVTREGYKDVEATLELVTHTPTVLACELVGNDKPDKALPCDLKKGDIEKECPNAA